MLLSKGQLNTKERSSNMLLTTIFYHVDNFCNEIEKHMSLESATNKGGRPRTMRQSEILTIYIFFQHSKIKTFKDYYSANIPNVHLKSQKFVCII